MKEMAIISPPHGSTSLETSNPSTEPLKNIRVSNSVSSLVAVQNDDPSDPASSEVVKSKRIVQISSAVLYCILGAGIVFGYAALKPILIKENVYRQYCTQEELDDNVRVCVQQEIRLNLIFTVAAVGTNVAALPVGAILDRYGPQVCGIISSILLTIGTLLFAFSAEFKFDGYLFGYLCLAIGGSFMYLPSLHLSHSIPDHAGFILAMISGAFDSSSALFLIYQKLYFKNSKVFGFKRFFLVYLIVPTFVFLAQIFFMPKVSYKITGDEEIKEEEANLTENQISERTALLNQDHRDQHLSVLQSTDSMSSKSATNKDKFPQNQKKVNVILGVMHGKSILNQILSPWFILITLFTIVQMTRINYFVATIRPQYEYILGSYEEAIEINKFFDTALPIGGLIAIPFIGLIIDNISSTCTIFLLLSVATIVGILGCLPFKLAAYANISLFVIYRPFYYTAISDYVAKVFGFKTFGAIYGLIISLAGLFNFTANGMDKLRFHVFHRNPLPINLFLLTMAFLIGLAFFIFVKLKSCELKRNRLNTLANQTCESVISVA